MAAITDIARIVGIVGAVPVLILKYLSTSSFDVAEIHVIRFDVILGFSAYSILFFCPLLPIIQRRMIGFTYGIQRMPSVLNSIILLEVECESFMNREYHRWFSPSLGRDMELLVFGHSGARVLVFPTSMGSFFQWEDTGMIAELGEHLEKGWIQLFCVDSVDAESWYAKGRHPAERAIRHIQYDHYILDEVLPFTKQYNSNPFLITVGASFGAYHAVNFALRYPQLVDRTIGLSGLYNVKRFTEGYSDDNVYFNNPWDFIKNEHDPQRLKALQHIDIILAIGRDDPSCSNNEAFSGILWGKGIGNALRIWDGWAHDWPWWRQMIRIYISGHD